jgi:ABC-type uncharacterized transport system permease subunit
MDLLTLLQLLDSTVRLATPLLLACIAGLFSERAGIFDIGLEGKMLAAAFLSAAVAYTTGNVWVGLLAGIGASLLLSAIHGVASITFRRRSDCRHRTKLVWPGRPHPATRRGRAL